MPTTSPSSRPGWWSGLLVGLFRLRLRSMVLLIAILAAYWGLVIEIDRYELRRLDRDAASFTAEAKLQGREIELCQLARRRQEVYDPQRPLTVKFGLPVPIPTSRSWDSEIDYRSDVQVLCWMSVHRVERLRRNHQRRLFWPF